MLVTSFRDGQNLNGMENHRLWDAPAKRTNGDAVPTNHEQMDLIRGMYERIVLLEQQQREQSVKVDMLTEELGRVSTLADAQKNCDGVLVWRVEQFHSKINSMSCNPNVLLYSPEGCYTSPHGYKFCARLNISSKVSGSLNRTIHELIEIHHFRLQASLGFIST